MLATVEPQWSLFPRALAPVMAYLIEEEELQRLMRVCEGAGAAPPQCKFVDKVSITSVDKLQPSHTLALSRLRLSQQFAHKRLSAGLVGRGHQV
jgi:hypothetical protein